MIKHLSDFKVGRNYRRIKTGDIYRCSDNTANGSPVMRRVSDGSGVIVQQTSEWEEVNYMKEKDFKVGKQYKNKSSGRVYQCIGHRMNGTPVLEPVIMGPLIKPANLELWVEHREPRKIWRVRDRAGCWYTLHHKPDSDLWEEIIHYKEVLD